jgi:hypothetical protein
VVDNLNVIDNSSNPFFSLRHFIIKVNFEINSLKTDDPSAIEKYAEFIHEYTHYLQTFTTTNGLSALLLHIDAIIKLTYSVGTKVIIKDESTLDKLLIEYKPLFNNSLNRMYWSREPRKLSNLIKHPCYFVKEMDNPSLKRKSEEVFISNIIDGYFYHITSSVLRENMAMMAYFHVRGIGQDSVMDFVKVYPSVENPCNSKYWIVFSYFFYKYPQITNVIVFTYFFCELALMTISTGFAIKYLLEIIDKKITTEKYTSEDVFFDGIKQSFACFIEKDQSELEKVIKDMSSFINRVSEKQEFYQSLLVLLNLAEKGLLYKIQHPTIFADKIDSQWIDKYSSMFYSPIIIQPDGLFSVLYNNEIYVQRIILLFSVSILIDLKNENKEICICPFYSNIPLCDMCKTDSTLAYCKNNPLEIPKFNEGGCCLYNAGLILGLLPVSELKKYVV